MKKIHKILPFILGGLLGLTAAVSLIIWCTSSREWLIREQLKIISPLFLEITFIALICTAVAVIMSLYRQYKPEILVTIMPPRILSLLSAIAAAGIILLLCVAPREHRIYYDEDIYQNIGQNIAETKGDGGRHDEFRLFSPGLYKRYIGSTGMCNDGKIEYGEYTCNRLEYNKEPNAWPFVLSIVYRIFGVGEKISFLTNNALFILSIVTVFLLGRLLFRNAAAGLYAALIFTFTPEVIIWSNTVAAEPGAACFAALSVLSMLLFLRFRTTSLLLFCVLINAFAIQFRPESIMICSVSGILLLLLGRDELKHGRLYVMLSLFIVLILPLLAHLYAVRDMGWGATGAKFSLSFFTGSNFRVNALFYLTNMRFPLVFTLLFFIGLLTPAGVPYKFQWQQRTVLLLWFLLFWGIFLFFYAGSYNYGADVRFSLLSAVPIALLAGNGASHAVSFCTRRFNRSVVQAVMASIIIASFLSFLPFIRAISQEAWAARADHHYAHEMLKLLPADAVVLTHNPNMFLVWGQSAAQASLATEQRGYFNGLFNRYKGGVYFHYNFWCNVSDPLQNSFCKNILANFNCTQVAAFKEKTYDFVLYRVEKK